MLINLQCKENMEIRVLIKQNVKQKEVLCCINKRVADVCCNLADSFILFILLICIR